MVLIESLISLFTYQRFSEMLFVRNINNYVSSCLPLCHTGGVVLNLSQILIIVFVLPIMKEHATLYIFRQKARTVERMSGIVYFTWL